MSKKSLLTSLLFCLSVWLFVPLAPASAASSVSAECALLDEKSVLEELGYEAYVRFPEQKVVDHQYLIQYIGASKKSNDEVFVPWLQAKDSNSFKSMLIEQHSMMVNAGHTGFYNNRPAPKVPAGLIRVDTQTLRFGPEKVPQLKGIFSKIRISNKINGIRAEARPRTIEDGPGEFVHMFPRHQFIEVYLQRMSEIMSGVQKELGRSDGKVRHSQIIALLSDYYHVGINAHVFTRVNNSLLMSQINQILSMIGYQPVPHGYLDYVAFVAGSSRFRKVFKNHIAQFQ